MGQEGGRSAPERLQPQTRSGELACRHARRSRHLAGGAGPGAADSRIRPQPAGIDQDQARRRADGDDRRPSPTTSRPRRRLDDAERNLARTHIVAPIAGVATQVDQIELGRVAPAGQPVFAIVEDRGLWVDANPKESDLTYVHAGEPASVTIDTFPGREFKGRVCSIAPGTGSQFSILPAQNASGNWVKVVQRVPLRFCFDARREHRGPARRHERERLDRHRAHALARRAAERPSSGSSRGSPSPSAAKTVAPWTSRPPMTGAVDARHADGLRHDGDHHAGARHDDRQRRPALHAGLAVDHPGPDQLGADLLHRRRGDHDLAARLVGDARSAARSCSSSAPPASPSPRCCAGSRRASSRWSRSACCRACSAPRWCRSAQAVMLDIYPPARRGSAMAIWGMGVMLGPDHGPDARRLADRVLFVALGVLRQPAVRHPDRARPLGLHERDARSAATCRSPGSASCRCRSASARCR